MCKNEEKSCAGMISWENTELQQETELLKKNNLKLTKIIKILSDENMMLKESNILWNKKWYAAGDSYTEGDFSNSIDENWKFEDGKYKGKNKVYPYIIAKRNNMTVICDGLCGSTMALSKQFLNGEQEKNYRTPFSFERFLQIPGDVDYITLWFGINDSANTNLGTPEDNDNTTFYGAWNFILKYLIKNYKTAKIGVIVTNGGKPEYRQATIDCCRRWGIPYLNLMGDYQIPPSVGGREENMGLCDEAEKLWYERFKVKCMAGKENDHPCPEWHEFQSTFIEAFLRRL